MEQYVIGIDQSTQGTKALLFDGKGNLLARQDESHRQYVDENGYVSHDPEEIYRNVILAVSRLVTGAGIDKSRVACIGISNQRETVCVWERGTGRPLDPAIVWQCARAVPQCERVEAAGAGEMIREKTGLPLSPYFCAAKLAWYMENRPGIARGAGEGTVCFGTVDSYLLYRLTGGKQFAADFSNASRTQLFNIETLSWDEEICALFGIPVQTLPRVLPSDSRFGETDLEGFLEHPVPVLAMLGDSHAALFGQGCRQPGMLKVTYGTGSSVMMHTGEKRVESRHGLATSIAWNRGGRTEYVLEGNINYTGAVIRWLQKDLGLLDNPAQSEELARQANPADTCCLVPAFSGLGAPHWVSGAAASLRGMTRFTGRAEIVRAGLHSIAHQITDVLEAMRADSGLAIEEIRADGGPARNAYLMQFQADMARAAVQVARKEELSGIGAAYMAGLTAGIYREEELAAQIGYNTYQPSMPVQKQEQLRAVWNRAVADTCREAREQEENGRKTGRE